MRKIELSYIITDIKVKGEKFSKVDVESIDILTDEIVLSFAEKCVACCFTGATEMIIPACV